MSGFSAAHLFSVLYEGICRDAYTQVASERQWARELNLEDFLRLVTECMAAHLDSPTTMKNSLRELWRGVSGLRVCVTCPFSRSHIFLRCGHGLCERCCWSRSRRDHFGTLCRLDRCPVCGVCISLAVRLKPPAAGYRGLALDGGGTRGMVELEILEHMAASLDVGLEPYQFFDIIAGTSTGRFSPKKRSSSCADPCFPRRHRCKCLGDQKMAHQKMHRRIRSGGGCRLHPYFSSTVPLCFRDVIIY